MMRRKACYRPGVGAVRVSGSLSGLRTMRAKALVLPIETPDQLQGLIHTPERAFAPDAAL